MRARFKKWNFYSDRVEVRIEGFQIGKLLDAAAKNGILLRSVRVYAETEAQAEIAACDLKRLQKLAGARYRVKPRARRGAVYQTRAFLRRPVLAIGVLLAAAMLCTAQTDTLGRRRLGWLGAFGLVYAVGAMTAMYITYTPVGMVRIVGLQTRYFLPVWLLLVLAAAAVLRRVLAPRLTAAKGEALAVTLCGWYAFAGAVLLFQHYFVGPVYTIYK